LHINVFLYIHLELAIGSTAIPAFFITHICADAGANI
jgi:hypothetical protein